MIHFQHRTLEERTGLHISHQHQEDIHVEPHLDIHPSADHLMAVACIVFDNTSDDENKIGRIRIFLSEDSGENWRTSYTSPVLSEHTGDPWVLIDKTGRVVVSSLGGKDRTITIYYSDDWGDNWETIHLPKYGMRSYDHPTISNAKNNTYLITASQGKGRGSEGYFGTRVIHLDRSFSLLNTWWYENAPYDQISGNAVIDRDALLVPIARNADYTKGYQRLLDKPTTDILRLPMTGNGTPLQSGISKHIGLGSFPVMIADPISDSVYYVARHILSDTHRNIHLWSSQDHGRTWMSVHNLNENFHNRDQYNPQFASSSDGIVVLTWMESADGGCIDLKYITKVSNSDSLSTPRSLYNIPSCNETEEHKNIIFLSHRSIADRFFVGGDYFGVAITGDNFLCYAYPHSTSGLFQLYFARINLENN